ncbi:MAG: hypothetical protein ISS79_06785 [Phycisphaerae bacterium]|nr:hypothetical protein [Phycisphaerae bacterium]
MPEKDRHNDNPKTANRKNKRIWLAAIVVLTTAIIVCLLWRPWNSESVDERLAEIEAARAIPDSENAAVIYNKLLQDPNATSPASARPEFMDDEAIFKTSSEPWLSKDYPDLAAWVEERQDTIERLLEASGFKECRFPIAIDVQKMGQSMYRPSAMREWAYLLRFAANNDIAEGRTDDAIAKWRCLVRMSEHLRQQPSQIDYIMAIIIDSIALQLSAVYIVEGDAVETRLRQIESIRFDTKDNWAAYAEQIRIVQDLTIEKLKEEFGPIEHVKYLFNYGIYGMVKPSDADLDGLHMRLHIASRRVNHILIALRRYKNKHSHWPETLDEIKSLAPAEVFVDPISGDSFVYKLADDTFRLYSKGKNKIDEDGQRNVTVDANTYESMEHEDDRLFWPPRDRKAKAKPEDSTTQKPETNKNPIE